MCNECRGLDSTEVPTLKQQEQLFRLFVERVKEYAIFLLDEDGCIISWNPGAEAFKGYRADEVLGKSFELFYRDEDRRAGRPKWLLQEARRTGRVEEEGWRVRKDGRRFWAHVVITALVDDLGSFTGFAKITRDLSERRAAEERLQEANQELERRIRERTVELVDRITELERLVASTVGRELKMIELERELERVRRELERHRG